MAIKRLMKEANNMKLNCDFKNFFAVPNNDDIFKWYFLIFNLENEYEMGIYMGQILIPQEYPMKPCDIVFITPNGRFKTNKKICLSFTSYHPESWANWTIEGMLIGLVSFFVSNDRTTGSIITSKNEKRKMALESLGYNLD